MYYQVQKTENICNWKLEYLSLPRVYYHLVVLVLSNIALLYQVLATDTVNVGIGQSFAITDYTSVQHQDSIKCSYLMIQSKTP